MGSVDDASSAPAPSSRTKSSVRRAREFKQFDEVNLLDVDSAFADNFDLVQKQAPRPLSERREADKPAVLSDVITNTSQPPAAALSASFSKRSRESTGGQRLHSSGKDTPRTTGAKERSTSSTFQPAAPPLSRVGRSQHSRNQPSSAPTSTKSSSKSGNAPPLPPTTQGGDAGLVKKELAEALEALEQSQREVEALNGKAKAWEEEREGLLCGLRSEGREVARLTEEVEAQKKTREELEGKLSEAERAAAEAKEAVTGLTAKIAQLETQRAEDASRILQQRASLAKAEEKVAGLSQEMKMLQWEKQDLKNRVYGLVLAHQQAEGLIEDERLSWHLEREMLGSQLADVRKQNASLVSELKEQKEKAVALQRAVEMGEAESKRLAAERDRLQAASDKYSRELLLAKEAMLSAENDIQIRRESPVSTSTFPRELTSQSVQTTTEPPLTSDGKDELWDAIQMLETEKAVQEQTSARTIESLQAKVESVMADREALWAECEQLSAKVERLQTRYECEQPTAVPTPAPAAPLSTTPESREGSNAAPRGNESEPSTAPQQSLETPPQDNPRTPSRSPESEFRTPPSSPPRRDDNFSEERSPEGATSSSGCDADAEETRTGSVATDRSGTDAAMSLPGSSPIDVAPTKSTSLSGITTRFGFVPPLSLRNHALAQSAPSLLASDEGGSAREGSPPLTDRGTRRETLRNTADASSGNPSSALDRRRALQHARNARKAESAGVTRKQVQALETILDEFGARKKSTSAN